jgi:hypothetical protein
MGLFRGPAMGRLLHMLITLPLIVSPLFLLASGPSHAATLSQADALRLLAKSKAANTKCNILGAVEADELASYLARAEIAMTQRSSVEDTQGTIAVGKALGSAATCDTGTADEVNGTLDAARRAMVAVEDAESKNSRSVFRVKPDRAKAEESAGSRTVTVDRYRQQAFAYYLERRCRHLPARQARSFWLSIVRQHKAALRRDGGRKVAAALRRAEASAESTPCGLESRRIVRAGYSESSAF